MIVRFIHYWEIIRRSYWLLPALMLLATIMLAATMTAIDNSIEIKHYSHLNWLVFASTDGARIILSTIAASAFAAATLTFSITMVTLSLASSQFGPRLLRNFLRDSINQFIFGAFIATFIYCLLILRGMGVNGDRIPNLSVALSILLVLIDAALFIWFIQHVTSSIQIDQITNSIGKDLFSAIDRSFPESYKKTVLFHTASGNLGDSLLHIKCKQQGYVQGINYEKLKEVALANEIVIKMNYNPGNYLLPGVVIAEACSYKPVEPGISEKILGAIFIGIVPTGEQDIEFGIRQLVQIAARALSPGINDPFTAMACIDRLGSGLAVIATRQIPSAEVYNDDGKLLVVKKAITFQFLCDASFRIIRQMSQTNPPVAMYLLNTLAQLAEILIRVEDKRAVLETAQMTANAAMLNCKYENDRAAIRKSFDKVDKILGVES